MPLGADVDGARSERWTRWEIVAMTVYLLSDSVLSMNPLGLKLLTTDHVDEYYPQNSSGETSNPKDGFPPASHGDGW